MMKIFDKIKLSFRESLSGEPLDCELSIILFSPGIEDLKLFAFALDPLFRFEVMTEIFNDFSNELFFKIF